MKHKRDSSLDAGSSALATKMTAEELRLHFAELNPHIPISAYDALLSQYAPSPDTSSDSIILNTSQSSSRQSLRSSMRKKAGDEMYETIPSTDLKFLLPGDTLTVYSHKAFPEQFEFSLHYMDKVSGQLKSVIAPHQSKWRALLSISRPSSGPLRASVSGPYNQITFTAPLKEAPLTQTKVAGAVSSSSTKSSFSSFNGSYFKKAGILEALPDLSTLELADLSGKSTITQSLSHRASSAPSMVLPRAATAPSTPTSGSPRNGPSPSSSSDDSGIQHFVSSALITSSFHTNQVSHTNTTSTHSNSRRLMPVAISFRTRITSNGAESIVASPLFLLADSVEQVDLFVCRIFRNALPESYPYPSTIVADSLPPRLVSAPKKASKTASATSSSTEEATKTEKTAEKSEKTEKSASAAKKSTSDSKKTKTETKTETKHKRNSSSRSKSPAGGKADSTTQAPAASVIGKCKPEVPVVETTSRFQALKFW